MLKYEVYVTKLLNPIENENWCPPVAGEVHVFAHPDQVLSDQQVGHAASLLNHLFGLLERLVQDMNQDGPLY